MASEAEKQRIRLLLTRGEDLAKVLRQNRVVDDVLAGREAVIGMAPDKSKGVIKTAAPVKIDPQRGLGGMDPQSPGVTSTPGKTKSKYLFQSSREHDDSYEKRLAMTPFTIQTGDILQSRLGTLAKANVTLDAPDNVKELLKSITLKGMSFDDVRTKGAELAQTGGFFGILVDRMPVSQDLVDRANAGQMSQAEKDSQQYGKPIWALYPAAQILDYREDAAGLIWVNLVEFSCEKAGWESPELYVYTVRCVDRKNITVFRVESPEYFALDGEIPDKAVLKPGPVVPHGATDDKGRPVVPFRMAHPFPGPDGIGRSVLEACAELDVCGLRILSSIHWCLYIAGDPTVVLATERDAKDVPDIGIGTAQMAIIKCGKPGQTNPETLSFLQLDVAGIEKQVEQFNLIVAQARSSAGKMAAAVQGPREQSGISKAWSFKSGEEKILFLIAEGLESVFNWCIQLTARYVSPPAAKLDPETCQCTYPHSYDIEGPIAVTELAQQNIPLFKSLGMNEAVKQSAEKVVTSMDMAMNDKMKADIEKISAMNLQPDAMLDAAGQQQADQQADAKDLTKQANAQAGDDSGAKLIPMKQAGQGKK